MDGDPGLAIQAVALRKHFGDTIAVDALDLAVRPRECVGLLGANGSGKSTTLQMLATLVSADGGRAWVAGRELASEAVAVRSAIGLVFQDSALDRSMTVEENLRFAGALYDMPAKLVAERSAELLALFALDGKRHVPVAALSGGMRRALDIARGVLHRPRVLFLDEPTAGLDPSNRRTVWSFLHRLRREQEMTMLFTTHLLDEASDCDQVVFMRAGRTIGRGSPQALTAQLGAFILDVIGDAQTTAIFATLGVNALDGDTLRVRIVDQDFSLSRLDTAAVSKLRSMQLRRPGLDDVYWWLNHAGNGL